MTSNNYKVELAKSAHKQYQSLPKIEQKKTKRKLKLLKTDPYHGKKLKGQLEGKYTLRAWPYRIIHAVGDNTVYVSTILHRQDAY